MPSPRSLPPPLPPPRTATTQRPSAIAPAIVAAQPAPMPPKPAAAMPSPTPSGITMDSMDSGLIVLSPSFLDALRKVVPRRRRAKLPYIVGVGLLAVVGIVGADRSTREFVADRLHHKPAVAFSPAALSQAAERASADAIVHPTAMTDQRPESAVAPGASAMEITSGAAATEPAAKQKKTRPRRAIPQVKEKRSGSGA